MLGLLKTSLIDFPGEVAAVIFTAGCNLACPYCHNPELVGPRPPADFVSREEVERFLRTRAGVLTGVCITGGEPLLHPSLADLVALVRSHRLKVKLDTNGMLPERLAGLDVDFVALDIKLRPDRYRAELGGPEDARRRLLASIGIARSKARREFRTTVVPGLVTPEDVGQIALLLEPSDELVLTAFRPGKTLDRAFGSRPPADGALLDACRRAARDVGLACRIRRTGAA